MAATKSKKKGVNKQSRPPQAALSPLPPARPAPAPAQPAPAPAPAGGTVFDELDTIRRQTDDVERDFHAKMAEARTAYQQKKDDLVRRMQDLVGRAAAGAIPLVNGVPAAPAPVVVVSPPTPPAAQRQPTPVKAAGAKAPAKPAAKGGGGKPKGGGGGKVRPDQRNYDNQMSLREAIWDVLDRSREDWVRYVPDLPAGSVGLKISEIKTIIEAEGKWRSSADDISNMLHSQFKKFQDENKVGRDGDRRYYIVAGAKLDGPPVDPATFHTPLQGAA